MFWDRKNSQPLSTIVFLWPCTCMLFHAMVFRPFAAPTWPYTNLLFEENKCGGAWNDRSAKRGLAQLKRGKTEHCSNFFRNVDFFRTFFLWFFRFFLWFRFFSRQKTRSCHLTQALPREIKITYRKWLLLAKGFQNWVLTSSRSVVIKSYGPWRFRFVPTVIQRNTTRSYRND